MGCSQIRERERVRPAGLWTSWGEQEAAEAGKREEEEERREGKGRKKPVETETERERP